LSRHKWPTLKCWWWQADEYASDDEEKAKEKAEDDKFTFLGATMQLPGVNKTDPASQVFRCKFPPVSLLLLLFPIKFTTISAISSIC